MTTKKSSAKGNVGIFMEENSQQIEKLQQQMLEMQKELEAKQSRELLANLLLLPDTYFENAEVVKAIEVLNSVKNDVFLEKEIEKKESPKKKRIKSNEERVEGTTVLLGDALENQNGVSDLDISIQENDLEFKNVENTEDEVEMSEHVDVQEFNEEYKAEELNIPSEMYDYPNVSIGEDDEDNSEEFDFEESYDEEYDAPEEFTEAADFLEICED